MFVALVAAIYKNLPRSVFSKKAAHLTVLQIGTNSVRLRYYKIHQDALKAACRLGHAGTNMLHTHYNQKMSKAEAVRFWNILPPTAGH